jgi:hypothetical protein
VRSRPSVRAGLVEISTFCVEWELLQRDCEELDVPAERVWPAHIANHPEAALAVNSEFRVEPEHHLPGADYWCLLPCRICDQHKPVGNRFAGWDKVRKALQEAEGAEQSQRVKAEKQAKARVQVEQRRRVEKRVAAARAAQQADEEARQRLESLEAKEDIGKSLACRTYAGRCRRQCIL